MSTKKILLLALVLVLSLTIRRTSAQFQYLNGTMNEMLMTKAGCPYICEGNNDTLIPYPFGIGANCAYDESFAINCGNSSTTGMPTPYVNGTVLEVLEITVNQKMLYFNGMYFEEYKIIVNQIKVSNPKVKSLGVDLTGKPFGNYNVTGVTAVLEWNTHGNCISSNFTCGVNARCKQLSTRDFGCSCPKGFDGNPYVHCDFNECADSFTNRCNMGCRNTIGGYRCYCYPGYELIDNYTCLDSNRSNYPYYNHSKNKAKPVIIGTTTSFGTLFLLLATWWIYKVVRKRNKMKLKQKFFKQNGGFLLQKQLSSGEEGNVEKTKLFTAKELEKATDRFNENRILGQGGQGTVYKGMLTDGRIVAVKKSTKVDDGQLDQFINEVVILSQIIHRNVVKLHGCCLETKVPLLVYEFVPNGTLFQYIHDQNEDFPLTWDVRLRIATEVASALFYLHYSASLPIYHRDIKSTNILLDDKYRAKVADFGTSRSLTGDQTHLTTRVLGTFGYLDPEYFQSSQFTAKSDVYSFGVVLVELLTGQNPISSTRSDEMRSLAAYFILAMEENRIFDIIDERVRNESRKEEIIGVANLARRCLRLNRRNRPTMKEVAMELEAIRMPNGASTIQQHYEEVDYDITEFPRSWETASTSNSTVHLDI